MSISDFTSTPINHPACNKPIVYATFAGQYFLLQHKFFLLQSLLLCVTIKLLVQLHSAMYAHTHLALSSFVIAFCCCILCTSCSSICFWLLLLFITCAVFNFSYDSLKTPRIAFTNTHTQTDANVCTSKQVFYELFSGTTRSNVILKFLCTSYWIVCRALLVRSV